MHVPCRRTRPTSKCELPSELKTEDFGENLTLILMKTIRAVMWDPDYAAKFQPVCSTNPWANVVADDLYLIDILLQQGFVKGPCDTVPRVLIATASTVAVAAIEHVTLFTLEFCPVFSIFLSYFVHNELPAKLLLFFFFVTSRNFALSAPFIFVSAADFKLF